MFKGTNDAHAWIGRILKLLFALVVAVIFVYSFAPEFYRYTAPIEWLERRWLKWAGVALLLLSLVWTVLAQAQMDASWHMGIDLEHQTSL